jgi:sugar O-acyltransferase (sialic acid O-acetyltransferase NeuD family)
LEKKEIYALGVGHNTPVFVDLAEACGYRVAGLYHYNNTRTGELDHGIPILGSFKDLFSEGLRSKNILLTMGNMRIRRELHTRIVEAGGKIPTLIHPSSIVSRFANIAESGVLINPFCYIEAGASVDDGTVILSHVNISHNTSIGENCFIAGGATVGAYTVVEDYVFIGQGALCISDKVKLIGANAFIGAGALVTKPVPQSVIVAGSPAKILRKRNDS